MMALLATGRIQRDNSRTPSIAVRRLLKLQPSDTMQRIADWIETIKSEGVAITGLSLIELRESHQTPGLVPDNNPGEPQ